MKLLIIGVCIGFIVGNIIGVVLMSIMAAASRDSREREYIDERKGKCRYTGQPCDKWTCRSCKGVKE